MVLDPFAGYGTTLAVAARLGRRPVGVELLGEHAALCRVRCPDAVVVEGDARQLADLLAGVLDAPVDLVLTSPPYMTAVGHPENPLTGYATEDGHYPTYLREVSAVFAQVAGAAAARRSGGGQRGQPGLDRAGRRRGDPAGLGRRAGGVRAPHVPRRDVPVLGPAPARPRRGLPAVVHQGLTGPEPRSQSCKCNYGRLQAGDKCGAAPSRSIDPPKGPEDAPDPPDRPRRRPGSRPDRRGSRARARRARARGSTCSSDRTAPWPSAADGSARS